MVMRNKLRNQRTESREALGVEPLKHMILHLINSFVMNVNLCMDSDHKHSHTCTGKCYFKYCFRVNSYKRSKLRDFMSYPTDTTQSELEGVLMKTTHRN